MWTVDELKKALDRANTQKEAAEIAERAWQMYCLYKWKPEGKFYNAIKNAAYAKRDAIRGEEIRRHNRSIGWNF